MGVDAFGQSQHEPRITGTPRKPYVSHPIRGSIVQPYGIELCKFRPLEEFLVAIKDIISGAFAHEILAGSRPTSD